MDNFISFQKKNLQGRPAVILTSACRERREKTMPFKLLCRSETLCTTSHIVGRGHYRECEEAQNGLELRDIRIKHV